MAYHTTPASLAMRQRSRFEAVIGKMESLHREVAMAGREDFEDFTDGGLSTRTLRRMGHPYARSGGAVPGASRGIVGDHKRFKGSGLNGQVKRSGMVALLPINRQSGRLRRSITLSGPKGKSHEYSLFAAAAHARYVLSLTGTKHMKERGLLGPTGPLRKRHKARMHTIKDIVSKAQHKA